MLGRGLNNIAPVAVGLSLRQILAGQLRYHPHDHAPHYHMPSHQAILVANVKFTIQHLRANVDMVQFVVRQPY